MEAAALITSAADKVTAAPSNAIVASPTGVEEEKSSFLFVDPYDGSGAKKGRRSARSFVMQKARREKPWSTSKNAQNRRRAAKGNVIVKTSSTSPQHDEATQSSASPRDLVKLSDSLSPAWCSETPDDKETRTISKCQACGIYVNGSSLCVKCSLHRFLLSGSRPYTVASGRVDPFGMLPITMNRKTDALAIHYTTVLCSSAIPIDVRNQANVQVHVLRTALHNPAAMHSVLCSSATHSYVIGRGTLEDAVYHKWQAVAEVNKSLSDPTLCINDANILAVFNLLCVEESNLLPELGQNEEDTKKQRMVHLMGLKRMIELRGGISAIHTDRCLQAFLTWHAIGHSVATFNPPWLDLSEASYEANPVETQSSSVAHQRVNIARSGQLINLHSHLIDVAQDVSVLVNDLSLWFVNDTSILDPITLQTRGAMLQFRLLELLSIQDKAARASAVNECMALGLLAFTTTIIQPRDRNFEPMQVNALSRLQAALKRTHGAEWAPHPIMLIWLLTIASLCASGAHQQSWLATQLREVFRIFNITSQTALECTLEEVLWITSRLRTLTDKLWNQLYGDDPVEDDGEPDRALFDGLQRADGTSGMESARVEVDRRPPYKERFPSTQEGSSSGGGTPQGERAQGIHSKTLLPDGTRPSFSDRKHSSALFRRGADALDIYRTIYTGSESIWSEAAVAALRDRRQGASSAASTLLQESSVTTPLDPFASPTQGSSLAGSQVAYPEHDISILGLPD